MQDIKVEVREIPIASIIVDHRAQRGFDEKWADELYEKWNPALAGILTVSARDNGTFHTTSGQHRLSALRRMGQENIWAVVVYGLDLAGEAENFLGQVGKNTQYVDKFRLAVVANREPEASLDKLLRAHGWVSAGSGTGTGQFKALARLRHIATQTRGMDIADDILGTITQAWGYDPEAAHQNIVVGFGKLYQQREVDRLKMIKAMRLTTPSSFRAAADTLKVRMNGTISAGTAHADEAVRLYNGIVRGTNRLQRFI